MNLCAGHGDASAGHCAVTLPQCTTAAVEAKAEGSKKRFAGLSDDDGDGDNDGDGAPMDSQDFMGQYGVGANSGRVNSSLCSSLCDLYLPDSQQPEEVVEINIPTFGKPLGDEVFLVKLPNFLSIDPR